MFYFLIQFRRNYLCFILQFLTHLWLECSSMRCIEKCRTLLEKASSSKAWVKCRNLIGQRSRSRSIHSVLFFVSRLTISFSVAHFEFLRRSKSLFWASRGSTSVGLGSNCPKNVRLVFLEKLNFETIEKSKKVVQKEEWARRTNRTMIKLDEISPYSPVTIRHRTRNTTINHKTLRQG